MKSKIFAVFLLFAILGLAPALAGVVFEIETKDHGSGYQGDMESAAQGRNLSMEILPGKRGGTKGKVIYRGSDRELVVVDHDDKSYMVIDEEAMKELGKQLSGVNQQIEQALKNVPESQRRAIEEMMKKRMPAKMPERPKSTLRKTSDRADKNGYPCVKYEILRDGRKVRELWVTDWDNIEGGGEMSDAFQEMAKFFRELMKSISGGLPGGFSGPGGGDLFEHLDEIDGFPVVNTGFGEDGSPEDESQLRSARRQTLDPAAFEPPPGYKRRSMLGR